MVFPYVSPSSEPVLIIPTLLQRPDNSSEHQSDQGHDEESGSGARAVLVVLGEPSAAPQPAERALDDPAPGQHDEAFHRVGSLDDLEWQTGILAHGCRGRVASIAAIGDGERECRATMFGDCEQWRDHVAVLHVGRRDHEVDQEALCIDADVALLAFDFLACVVPGRIV